MNVTISLAGEKAIARRLRAMSVSMQGAVLRPVVTEAANRLRDLAKSLAPRRTGVLRAGIATRLGAVGTGFCKYGVTLDPVAWYGKFQEFGLGSGASKGPSARTLKRRANYDASMRTRRLIQGRMKRGAVSGLDQAVAGLGKSEVKRQRILAKGGSLQGQRRPNMAPHPFLKPAIAYLRASLRAGMVKRLWEQIQRYGGGGQ